MLLSVVLGLLFLGTAWVVRLRPRPGEVATTGTVVESRRAYAYGEPVWRSTVEVRDHTGAVWRFRPELDGPRRPVPGRTVAVTYLPADPQATARRTDGPARWYPWALVALAVSGTAVGLLSG